MTGRGSTMESTVKEKSIFDLKGIEKLNYARRQLETSLSNDDKVMTKYWLDTIHNINLTIGNDAINPELKEALRRLEIAVESSNMASISYWNEVIDGMVETVQKNHIEEQSGTQKDDTPQQNFVREEAPKTTSKEDQLIYAREQFKVAMATGDEETANLWQNVIEGVTKEISSGEYTQNAKTFDIYPQATELANLYECYTRASKRGETEIADRYAQSIKDIIKDHPLAIEPSTWESYTEEERLRFMNLKAIETDILGEREEHEYWLSYIKRLTLEPQSQN